MKRYSSLFTATAGLIAWSLFTISFANGQSVTFSINTTQSNQAISPWIYGINGSIGNLNLTNERQGGNRWTAYNYTNNFSNAGSDFFYHNDNLLSSSLTPGAAVMPGLNDAASHNAAAIITVPTAGWVSTAVTGNANPNQPPDQSQFFTPSYPTQSADPSPAASHVYQDQFVTLIKNAFPNGFVANSSKPIFFSLDNEPDLWKFTHQEVHPAAATYAEVVQRSTDYSAAIKSVAPNSLVFGAVNYGWQGYVDLQGAPDSSADNNAINPATGQKYGNFLSYYLAQMKVASTQAGKRLLDVLDVHWYPEATGANASGVQTRITNQDNSPGVAAARVQAPRSLWDSSYVENSWIAQSLGNQAINLIPRVQGQINTNYAGTKLSISEYNYGGATDISGGIAEADVLGIYGKQGVFSANEWPLASKEPFILGAMEMYRNFDGHGGAFGDTAVSATTSNAVNTSIYASIDSTTPGRMVLVAINKTSSSILANIGLNSGGPNYTSFAVYRLSSSSTLNADGSLATPTFVNTFPISALSSFSLPGNSVETFVFTAPVPEPSTFALATLSVLAGLAALRRKSRSAAPSPR